MALIETKYLFTENQDHLVVFAHDQKTHDNGHKLSFGSHELIKIAHAAEDKPWASFSLSYRNHDTDYYTDAITNAFNHAVHNNKVNPFDIPEWFWGNLIMLKVEFNVGDVFAILRRDGSLTAADTGMDQVVAHIQKCME